MTLDRRVFSICIGSALLFQNYWCHLTSTLYKPDTSLRRTVGVSPDSVHLRESSLFIKNKIHKPLGHPYINLYVVETVYLRLHILCLGHSFLAKGGQTHSHQKENTVQDRPHQVEDLNQVFHRHGEFFFCVCYYRVVFN